MINVNDKETLSDEEYFLEVLTRIGSVTPALPRSCSSKIERVLCTLEY